jgi:aspartyl-tRNA(Asn)/glutamyl-tRNA(Gln) amidotransferase subunit A
MPAELSSSARLEACLEAEKAWNPHVNAVITSMAPSARREAAAADRAQRDGRWLGLLHGVPVAVKDNIDTAGTKTTMASLFFRDNVPNRDAPVITRLKKAGAVISQKVTLHEFAFGVRSMSSLIGQCKNPWDTTRIPGGSSGGSGVAVATGMAEMALGTDTGGSVRIPAALNGITGLRPTSGRVPNSGCFPVSASHDTIGPMARSALDCARLFAVMAGYEPDDPTSRDQPLENFLPAIGDGIAGVRIGVVRRYYFDNVPADRAAALEAAITRLEALGAKISEVTLQDAERIQDACAIMIYCDACDVHRERIQDPSKWAPQTIERLKLGLDWKGVDYAASVRVKEAWMRTLAKVFDKVDALLTPTTPIDPPPHAEDRSLWLATKAVAQNTYNGAFGHIPGLAVPCGFSAAGLPVSMQLEAAWWKEPLLLRVGHAYQQVTDWHTRRPSLPKA